MSNKLSQLVSRSIITLAIVAVVAADARPSHFGENVQQASTDQESNAVLDTGLKPWQLELLARRLSEINSNQISGGGVGGDLGGWEERGFRNPEFKRQSRYRQCYFNPISCFRK